MRVADRARPPARLPVVIHVLALGTFLMGTTEFVVAGLLPEIAGDLWVSVAQAGLLITVFAVGMIVGAPLMAMLTLRLPARLTLVLALGVFAAGHVIVALGSGFVLLLAARFLTALATGAFWAVANVLATRVAGPAASSRALGVVGSGAMLANVVRVPLGAFAGQLMGRRGPFIFGGVGGGGGADADGGHGQAGRAQPLGRDDGGVAFVLRRQALFLPGQPFSRTVPSEPTFSDAGTLPTHDDHRRRSDRSGCYCQTYQRQWYTPESSHNCPLVVSRRVPHSGCRAAPTPW
ncbi:MFS transporter [Streptomyces sp. TRM70350]|uniref:MFS transporter n=1 Tax=Streptomyces sp. TRM70350 TaxID=2856165 RepID=UPI0027DF97E6|nr:MFS transporter [Streptomyces sp. TRM70350]